MDDKTIRLERFENILNESKPKGKIVTENTLSPIHGFDFVILENNEDRNNVFKFDNIDDFINLIRELNRSIEVDLVVSEMKKRLQYRAVDLNSEFILRLTVS